MEIKLEFNSDTFGLAGFPYGEEIFNEQILPKISDFEESDMITIVFPPQIERVASSFVQGLFNGFFNTFKVEWVENNIAIKAATDDLAKDIQQKV